MSTHNCKLWAIRKVLERLLLHMYSTSLSRVQNLTWTFKPTYNFNRQIGTLMGVCKIDKSR